MAKVKVGDVEVDLDPEMLKLNEHYLNDYLSKEASLYSFYGSMWANASYVVNKYEDEYEQVTAKKFREHKEEKATDKLADSLAKSDPEVIDLQAKLRAAKRVKDQIWMYLKSMDKNHENALNMGYNVRKEINMQGRDHVKSVDGFSQRSLESIIR